MPGSTWERLRESYDAVADAYEATFGDELAAKPADRARLAAFAAAVGDPVVDLGCGPGQVGAAVRDGGRSVLGLDFSPAMARLAAARLGAATAGDLRALPVRSASVAGVVAFYALIHLRREELATGVAEIARVLRPGGRALLTAHEGEGTVATEDFLGAGVPFVATLLSLDELVVAAEASGLGVVATDRRPPLPQEHPTVRLTVELVRPA
ncbi:class I SAM-dependent methyltransferase [Iamia sp. SCSIO 61187]|uniref:class I SAM-dependent methyltransferase n=1 Tax=Iamia sp. SCSIO 61187 TaxID=2722752 RepID=UPI001C63A923|nr:class I SAM-dependent methyltransferase [Iamia sp. SCSIO 61187]QYG91926.1 class I SAM-dependent methyltransferase [Iamia sp. SCSIO 61187]